ncbi:MAG: NADH-quinone oxidoreductase subunit J [Puniceicoccales bacterium]|jgi:NADH:ubiquinone oxidoreductase subunit 6 (subunit J)|nr:NADH-quinone oxidoreductase subunit J [Puniceicoccales bacterium]
MELLLSNAALCLVAVATIATAAVALSLRGIVHATLLLVPAWFGVAAFYLWADAQFIAFAQVLVYVGAISMVALFAVLLTRAGGGAPEPVRAQLSVPGAVVAAAVAVTLVAAVLNTPFDAVAPAGVAAGDAAKVWNPSQPPPPVVPERAVAAIGRSLVEKYIPELLAAGVLLTVALLGAVLLAASPKTDTATGNAA